MITIAIIWQLTLCNILYPCHGISAIYCALFAYVLLVQYKSPLLTIAEIVWIIIFMCLIMLDMHGEFNRQFIINHMQLFLVGFIPAAIIYIIRRKYPNF